MKILRVVLLLFVFFIFSTGVSWKSEASENLSEADFFFDEETEPYKKIIIEGVSKIALEDVRCRTTIEERPIYVIVSDSKSTKDNPVFFLTCGEAQKIVNVFFSKQDVLLGKSMAAPQHMSKEVAIEACKKHVKSQAVYPIEFSRRLIPSVYEAPNGRTRVSFSFTEEDAFGLPHHRGVTCLIDPSGDLEASLF